MFAAAAGPFFQKNGMVCVCARRCLNWFASDWPTMHRGARFWSRVAGGRKVRRRLDRLALYDWRYVDRLFGRVARAIQMASHVAIVVVTVDYRPARGRNQTVHTVRCGFTVISAAFRVNASIYRCLCIGRKCGGAINQRRHKKQN
jgi:hypothetical protein